MNAEVISIGDELTSGQRLDTNSQWLSQQLGDLGVRVVYHTTVADDMDALCDVFERAVHRADVVLATGGLGPTADDLTREAIARVAGSELELDDSSLAHIREIFARLGREMPQRNEVQAYVPRGGTAIPNAHGTAPGIAIDVARRDRVARMFALPGVPSEMHQMFRDEVRGSIERLLPRSMVIVHRAIKCFGEGESAVEAMLPDLVRRGREPSVGITVSKATITLRITARDESREGCRAQIEPTERIIRECLGALVFGTEDEELEDAVVALLRQSGRTLAVAEWGTRGLVTHWLHGVTEPTGGNEPSFVRLATVASDGAGFIHGATAGKPTASEHDPFTAAGIEQLARVCREAHGTDVALVIGPIVTSALGDDTQPRIVCAVAHAGGVAVRRPQYTGPPDMRLDRCAKHALDLVRHCLMGVAD